MFFLFHSCNIDGKKLATEHDCKFIETSSGIQHNVDELLVGVLKQIRLREDLNKKRRKKKLMGSGSRTSLSLGVARDILQKMCLQDNRSKSCENLLVLWNGLHFIYGFSFQSWFVVLVNIRSFALIATRLAYTWKLWSYVAKCWAHH